ncbi:MAG: tol-pal system-associated acyl-CoA thioesterase [Ectothiorhodospiraceae bacterium]
MSASPFSWPVRVYYEDTDAGGVVYHASYLRFCERARTEWLRAGGFDQHRLRHEHGLLFAVHALETTFHRPARLDDVLRVTCEVTSLRSASIVFRQRVLPEADMAALCTALVTVACINETFTPCAIPRALRSEMQHAR